MKEIGGYIDFERYRLPMLYDEGIKLNSGRNCLAYIIKANNIKSICIPYYICDCIIDTCRKYGVTIKYYHVGIDFKPVEIQQCNDDWVYIVNYFGQISHEEMIQFSKRYNNIIVDNAQAYFNSPVKNTETIYTCRKFFGVPDGGVLFSNRKLKEKLVVDESFQHMVHLVGRFERTASEFYNEMKDNNQRFANEDIKQMSKLTENLLHSIDYEDVRRRRDTNYLYLSSKLNNINLIKPKETAGPFAYPLMVTNAEKMRKELINHNVYIPILWPNVKNETDANRIEFKLANNILPLPCDQRYELCDMELVSQMVLSFF